MTPANDRWHAQSLRRTTRHLYGPVTASIDALAWATDDTVQRARLKSALSRLLSVCRELDAIADTLTGTPE
jgi:hypothetical protein